MFFLLPIITCLPPPLIALPLSLLPLYLIPLITFFNPFSSLFRYSIFPSLIVLPFLGFLPSSIHHLCFASISYIAKFLSPSLHFSPSSSFLLFSHPFFTLPLRCLHLSPFPFIPSPYLVFSPRLLIISLLLPHL